MAFLTIRLPESLKKKMKRIKGANWSEIIRGAIEQKVKEETRKRRKKDRAAIFQALTEQDRIAEMLSRKPATGWSSVGVIRYWREHRYSSSMRQ